MLQHLLPALERPREWDVLIGHYLGVDHAGHTYGVASQQMTDKVMQMDEQVAHVLHKLAAAAGPGGPYERGMLLVMGDHGQTMGGDHGGGSAHETDSVLLAVSLQKLHAALQRRQQRREKEEHGSQQQEDVQHQSREQHRSDATAFLQQLHTTPGRRSPAINAGNSSSSRQPGPVPHPARQLVCAQSIPQIDLTPTLAVLLGVAVPYGNVGRLAPELWAVLGSDDGKGVDGLLASYQGALWDNVQQVRLQMMYGKNAT